MANLGPTNIEGNLIIKNQTHTPNMSSDGTSSRVVVLDDDGILRYKTNFADVNHDHNTTYLGINAKAADSDLFDGYDSLWFNRVEYLLNGNWDSINTGTVNTAKTYRVENSVINPPLPNIYNWSLYQQGNSLRGSQLAISAYNGNEMLFRGANEDTNTWKPWCKVWHSNNFDPATKLDTTTINGTQNYITKYGATGITQSNIQDDGTTPKYGANTLWHSGNDGLGSGLDADLLDGNEASYFATSTHNHDGTYSTTDTKNTAGATNTSSKIYLVGSADQTANPQTYTHDTAYVDVDGNVYSGSSKTITNSDLVTNQIVTPTLNPTWTVRNYAGTVVSSPTNPSGEAITGTNIVLEYGFKPSMIVKGKWVTQAGYDNPTSCSGLCGTSLPASTVETAATSSIDLYNSTTYSSTTVPITTSAYWTISTPKKGITISGSSLVLPIGNISASARVQVTYQLPIYYGNVTSLTIIEADVKALSTKTWKNYQISSKTISPTINSNDSQYWIYAYPAAWGSLTTISNADGDWTAAFTSGTVTITGAPGLAISYNYYITVNKGAFKSKTINFS